MKRLYGNTSGLKPSQTRRLENLYRRRIPVEYIISRELAKDLTGISREIRRQIGLLINRQGKIVSVIIGDDKKIVIPSISDYRAAPGRLKGLRCIHTHLHRDPLSRDDLNDLALLRLDMMAAITDNGRGLPKNVHVAHVLPNGRRSEPYRVLTPLVPSQLNIDCLAMIRALEAEMNASTARHTAHGAADSAMLVKVTASPKAAAEESLTELKALAHSSGIDVVGSILQRRSPEGTYYLLSRGKLHDLAIRAQQAGANVIIFDQELNPSQIRSIADQIELKVIDRTQLILDIFAQRAQTKEGKLQVELAQLKYLLPRLVSKNTAMSRLTGGIGGRGPGETKLEINRRRARERISNLEKSLLLVRKQRKQQRAQRQKKGLPVISIIGYTNAGKSTLLNTLTDSNVLAEKRLFATLDPSSRRLKFPRDAEVIITDTVGFIRDLPKDLMVAFRATLEELEKASLLLHVIDISNPQFDAQMHTVEKILAELNLQHTATVRVFNKMDLVSSEFLQAILRQNGGVAISAVNINTLLPLIKIMERKMSPHGSRAS